MYKILEMKLRAEAFKEIVGFLEPESPKQQEITRRLKEDERVMRTAVISCQTFSQLYKWVSEFAKHLGW